jgi:nucleoside-diphosphate-sugar epimerase
LTVVLHITKVLRRIAQVAPLFEPVPPQLYGGTERVVSHLTEELVRHGHDVTLFASGDSQTAATLVPVVPRAMRLGSANRDLMLVDLIRELDLVFNQAGDFDVIH